MEGRTVDIRELAGPKNKIRRSRGTRQNHGCGALHREVSAGYSRQASSCTTQGECFWIDLLSCYQHAIISSQEKRELFWTTLGRYTASLPQRNILIVAGDFNCSATRSQGSLLHRLRPGETPDFESL